MAMRQAIRLLRLQPWKAHITDLSLCCITVLALCFSTACSTGTGAGQRLEKCPHSLSRVVLGHQVRSGKAQASQHSGNVGGRKLGLQGPGSTGLRA